VKIRFVEFCSIYRCIIWPHGTSSFSGRLLSEITPYDLERFRNERIAKPVKTGVEKMPEGLKRRDYKPRSNRTRTPADVNRILSILRHMFSKAIEWEMMEQSPFDKVKNLFYKENNTRLGF